jgi:hypothetical protein
VRQIKANVPIRFIAVGYDTSVAMIERHYSAEIADYADEIARGAMLDTASPVGKPRAANVIPLHAAS